jgi:hypothetical protein
LRAIGLQYPAYHFGQAVSDLLAYNLPVCLAEQLVAGHGEQGVIGRPELEIGAVLVELEDEVVD